MERDNSSGKAPTCVQDRECWLLELLPTDLGEISAGKMLFSSCFHLKLSYQLLKKRKGGGGGKEGFLQSLMGRGLEIKEWRYNLNLQDEIIPAGR